MREDATLLTISEFCYPTYQEILRWRSSRVLNSLAQGRSGHEDTLGRNAPDRGNRRYKGPEAGACSTAKKDTVAEADTRWEVMRDEFREVIDHAGHHRPVVLKVWSSDR